MKDFVKSNINNIISVRTDTGVDREFLNILIKEYNKIPNADWVFFSNWLSKVQL